MAYAFIYRGEYVHIIGDLKAGLLFSYLLSYIVLKNRYAERQYKDGKIIFTYEKINADTGLNRKEINKAMQILNKQNLIEAKKNINKGITEINIKINQDEYEKLKVLANKGGQYDNVL